LVASKLAHIALGLLGLLAVARIAALA